VTQQAVQPAAVGARPRLVWVDVAKAVAIALVVLNHVVVFADAAGWLPPVVTTLNDQAATFRMPLFFLASGLFAGTALRKPWAVVLRRRILFFAYLYLLWTVIRFALFQVIPDVRPSGADADLHAVLWSPLLPGTGLWFIYALAVFSALAKLTLRAPAWLQLAAAAALSAVVGSGRLDVDNFAWRNMAVYYVFFLAGAHLRRTVEAFAEAVTPLRTAGLAVAAAAGAAAVHLGDLKGLPGVWLALSCLAVAAGVALSAQVARIPRVAGTVAELGRRTLPVYLLHVPGVALLVAVLEAAVEPALGPGALLVPVLAAVVVALSLALHRPLRRGLPWLFALPGTRTAPA
jgi:uncharacterized membrane protein YcfT